MRILLAFILTLLSVPIWGQEVKLPAEVRGMAGAWIPVKPDIVSGGKPKWRVDPALQEIDIEDFFGPEAALTAKGKIFQCTDLNGGRFKVECWNAAGDTPSDIATCLIIVTGINPNPVPPAPIPPGPTPPTPTPPGPTPPNPQPAGPLVALVVHESSQKFQPWTDTINLLRSGPSAEYLSSKGHRLLILDNDETGAGGRPSTTLASWRPHFSGMTLPVIFLYDEANKRIIHKQELPQKTTKDTDVINILKAHGG